MTTQNPVPKKEDVAPPNVTEEEVQRERGRPLTTGKGGKIALGGGNKSFFTYAILVAVSLALSFFFFGQGNVKQQDFTTNLGNISADIAKMKDSDKALAADIAGIKTAVSAQGNQVANTDAKIAPLSAQIAGLQSSVNGISGTVSNQVTSQISGQIAGLAKQSDVTSLQSQMSSAQSGIGTVKDGVAGLKTTIDDQAKTIKDLQDKVSKLSTTTSTTNTGGASTSGTSIVSTSLSGVTASIQTYTAYSFGWGTGPSTMSLAVSPMAVPDSSGNVSGSTSFQLVIDNQSGNPIKNIQMSLGFVFMDSSGAFVDLPSDATVILNSMGNPVWTPQRLDGHTWAFNTGSGQSAFGSIWTFNQGTGIQTYYCTINAKMTRPNGVGYTYMMYPAIKLVSFAN